MGIAVTNFMTLAISPDLVSSVHAFAIVSNSVSNHTPKSGCPSGVGLRLRARDFGACLNSVKVLKRDREGARLTPQPLPGRRLKPGYKTEVGNTSVMIGRASLAHDGY